MNNARKALINKAIEPEKDNLAKIRTQQEITRWAKKHVKSYKKTEWSGLSECLKAYGINTAELDEEVVVKTDDKRIDPTA